MGRQQGHPCYQSRRDCKSHAVQHPHFTNTGAKVNKRQWGTRVPAGMCLCGRIHEHLEAGARSTFLVFPPVPGPVSAPFIGVSRTMIHPMLALGIMVGLWGFAIICKLTCRRAGALVFIELVAEHKSASTCFRTMFSWQIS